MDESSPVYENFSNKMTAMSGRPKLNVTNMKSPFSGGGSIVPKMAAGSRFIPRPSGRGGTVSGFIPKPSGRGGTIIPSSDGELRSAKKRRSDAKPFGQVKAEIDLKEERKKSRNVFKMMANLKEKIAINSKKITLLKNILQTKDSYGGKEDPLEETNKTIEEIGKIIEKDYDYRISQEKEENENLRKDKSKEKQDESESKLENVKKVGQKVGQSINEGVSKVTSPIGNIFSGIAESLKFIGFGILANNAFDWLKDEENREKLSNFFKFIASKWKWVLGIGAGLIGLKVLGSIIGIVKIVGTVIGILASPLALKAIAAIAAGVLIYKAGKFLIDKTRDFATGGGQFNKEHDELDQKLKDAGMNNIGLSDDRTRQEIRTSKHGRSPEQEKIFEDVEAKREKLHELKNKQKGEIKELLKERAEGKKVLRADESKPNDEWSKSLTEYDRETERLVQGIKDKYGKMIISSKKADTSENLIKKSNTEKNNIDTKVTSVTPISRSSMPSMLNMDLGTDTGVDIAGDIDPSGGEANEIEVIDSINLLNPYMKKTPKTHQIM